LLFKSLSQKKRKNKYDLSYRCECKQAFLVIEQTRSIQKKKELLTYNSPKYLEWNLAGEKLEEFSPLQYKILSFKKCLN